MKGKKELKCGELFASHPGRLNCHKILHVVCPQWSGGSSGEKQMLVDCIKGCLDRTCELGLSSIAIPAVNTDMYSYLISEASETIVEAVRDHLGGKNSPLKKIYLIDISREMVDSFVQALKNVSPETTFSSGLQGGEESSILKASGENSENEV